jgi:hypothetical protein
MDDHAVHGAASDQLQQTLNGGPPKRRAGVAVIIEPATEQNPAQPLLRLNERAAQIELDLTGREVIVLIYRATCVDGAANGRSERHGGPVRSQIHPPDFGGVTTPS